MKCYILNHHLGYHNIIIIVRNIRELNFVVGQKNPKIAAVLVDLNLVFWYTITIHIILADFNLVIAKTDC